MGVSGRWLRKARINRTQANRRLSGYVLDVEGERLVVSVGAAENTPDDDVAEAESIFESIVVTVP
jgi:hypothetical protein